MNATPPTTASTVGEAQARLSELGIEVFQRGWLSANNILLRGDGPTALVDSGYHSHSEQTCALLCHALGGDSLDLLLNTHLHSDHCGGNARLQARFKNLQTLIPPGLSEAVRAWDEDALTYAATGQECQRFRFEGLLWPGSSIRLGSLDWQVHGAKGHDPHAVILFQADHGVLLSADALWENGFGVVFPELEGQSAFDEVEETLNVIEALSPKLVIPGHGQVFYDVKHALGRARSRLKQFRASPQRHLRHAHKVLIKFRLLAWQRIHFDALFSWTCTTPYLANHMPDQGHGTTSDRQWLESLLMDLEQSGALSREGSDLVDR
jgi:glyoxylase-like metal-dependent hydrolase (beta-lactamase superfamily II)